MSSTAAAADSADLEALFDSIVTQNSAQEAAVPIVAKPASAAKPAGVANPRAAKVNGKSKGKAGGNAKGEAAIDVMGRIGHLTRTLHDTLRELGYDHVLEEAAAAMPDARDRLAYVVKMTEQAAVRALNATEFAQPIQERLGADAEHLSAQWQKLFDRQMNVDEFRALVERTRAYLAEVPAQTQATNKQLLEIMMAQDFQDLTGQVIKKITALAQGMEQQLLNLLVDMAPPNLRNEINSGLLNGPVVDTGSDSNEVVTNQNQVDDLLASLGF